MNEPLPLFTARALSIGYVDSNKVRRPVAENLSLDLWPGELVCLLGPNGAGKSTLMRTMAGLQPPLAGQIAIAGRALPDLKAVELARKLSLVLSERMEVNLAVPELVALGRTPHTGWLGSLTSHDRERVRAALEATDTLQYQDRRVNQLSDGERQKVMVARALAQDTDLILLDEPTAHLDLPNRIGMMRLLHRLTRQTRKAILLSTHELDLALQAADRLWLLSPQGQLLTGTPEDLVLSGAFAATFTKEGVSFDKATGTFSLHPEATGPSICLTGDDSAVFWTRRALQREGYRVTSSGDALAFVEAVYRQDSPRWYCRHSGIRCEFRSVGELLEALQALRNQATTAFNIC